MKLDQAQGILVTENLNLVHKVIHDKVHNPHHVGIFSYDDLFQIGCIGLCKAVATDKGGVFSTYAYRLIWNEICTALEYASVRYTRESLMDPGTMVQPEAVAAAPDINHLDLEAVLDQAEQQASGVTAKGIHALRLKAKGFTSCEIGEVMGAPVNHVTAWIAKARAYLKSNSQLNDLYTVG